MPLLFGIFSRGLSGEAMVFTESRGGDRRIQKTQKLLREALAALIREKAYESISVKEILDRANVGRSTFYMHFRDKDELLVSGIRDMLLSVQSKELPRSAKPHEKVVRFSLPIFEHIYQHSSGREQRIGAKAQAILHGHLQTVLVRLIADDVRKHFRSTRKTARQISPELLALYVASTFILVLNWWIESRTRLPPTEIDDLFRALILPTLAAAQE